jgi:glucose-6-phosphate 1-epimerase
MEINNKLASAKISLQGAHIYSYKPKGKDELFWLSELSEFEKGKAIRGGVPICWPSFGMNNPKLPQHGFARVTNFEHIYTKELDAGTTQVLLRLKHNARTQEIWPYKFQLDVKFIISESLKIELSTTNLDTQEICITQALHSYFNVSNIEHVEIFGLEQKPFFDALLEESFVQEGVIKIDQEFDKVYQKVDTNIVLQDKIKRVEIQSDGSSSVVVWNPWIEKCKRMSAMKEDAYKEFVCIETANAFDDYKIIKPQQTHTLSVIIK